MTEPIRRDEDVAEELLALLREEEPTPPAQLENRTIRRVKTLLTARELIDVTTVVFLLRFCAPLLDLVAAMIGGETARERGRREDE